MAGVIVIAAGNWWPAFQVTRGTAPGLDVWDVIGIFFLAAFGAAIFREMWIYRGPNRIVIRLGLTAFILVYLGLLPSFLAQLRWPAGERSTVALALAVFVPKGNDIGAYFTGKFLTGRLLGR